MSRRCRKRGPRESGQGNKAPPTPASLSTPPRQWQTRFCMIDVGICAVSGLSGGAVRQHVGDPLAPRCPLQHGIGPVAGPGGRPLRRIPAGPEQVALHPVPALRSLAPELLQPAEHVPPAAATASCAQRTHTRHLPEQPLAISPRTYFLATSLLRRSVAAHFFFFPCDCIIS
jgi:hypothetical protein